MSLANNVSENEFEDEFAKMASHFESENKDDDQPKGDAPTDEEKGADGKVDGATDETVDIDDLGDGDNSTPDVKGKESTDVEPEIEDLNPREDGKKQEPNKQDEVIASLLKEIESLKNTPKFASPEVAKINEYIANGGKITKEFWELQSKDYSQVDIRDSKKALEVLHDKMKYEEGLDDATIEKILRKDYPILTGRKEEFDYEEEDKEDESVSLFRAAKQALPVLQEIQNKAKLPDVDTEKQAQIDHAYNLYRAQSRESIKNYQGLIIELDDNLRVKSTPSDKTQEFIKSVVTEPANQGDAFFQRYLKDGKVDYEKFASEMQLLDEWKDISRKIYQQGLKRGERLAISRELQQQPQGKPKASNPKSTPSNDEWIKNASDVFNQTFSI